MPPPKGWIELTSSWLFQNVRKLLIPIIAFGLILLFIFPISDMSSSSEGDIIQAPTSTSDFPSAPEEKIQHSSEEEQLIMVDVKGMVKYPGVYKLPTGSRMIDAIEMAGGYLPESDSISINHAQILIDEMAIYIPFKGEEAVSEVQFIQTETDDGIININTADESMLTSLPGIGPSKAKAILSFREENGLFTSPEDLKKVTGIGEKTYEQLKDHIKIK